MKNTLKITNICAFHCSKKLDLRELYNRTKEKFFTELNSEHECRCEKTFLSVDQKIEEGSEQSRILQKIGIWREQALLNWVLGSAPGHSRRGIPSKWQPLDRQDAQAEWNGKKLYGLWVTFLLTYKELVFLLARLLHIL